MFRAWTRFALAALFGATSQLAAAVTVIDLTTVGTQATVNGAIFIVGATATSGTGLIDSFVRIQAHGSNTTESGYNTSNYANQPELGPLDMLSGSFTHDLTLGSLATNIVTLNHRTYYEFLLDTNQNRAANTNGNLISLDKLEFFRGPSSTNTQTCTTPTSGSGSNTAYVAGTGTAPGTLCGLSAVYSLDTVSTDYSIKLDSSNYAGSGQLDMFVLVPTALFGSTSTDKVYLYSKFGELEAANAGFEEWSRKRSGTFTVPIPGTALLFGAGLLGMGAMRRRIRA